MVKLNISTWNDVYLEGRSLLQYPDETIASYLSKHRNKFKRGIDIACGAGRHTFLMANYGIEAFGVDSSEAAIQFAQKKVENSNLKSIHFEQKLANEINYEDKHFDLVIIWGLIHYLSKEDQAQLIEKVYKMLVPNGTLLCTLRSTHDSRAYRGKNLGDSQFLVDYFDAETSKPKQTVMYFWEEDGVKKLLNQFNQIELGHRTIEPIGELGNKTAHWLITAKK